MKTKILISILLIVILMSSGCGLIRRAPTTEPKVVDYHKGTGGVEMNFVKNLPPKEIIEGSSFAMSLELKNMGAYDIEDGRITISGFDRRFVTITPVDIYFSMEGRQAGFPEGGYEIVNFDAQTEGSLDIEKEVKIPFRAIATYRYQTEAGIDICINPNIYNFNKKTSPVCEPGEVKTSGGQGAPVVVTKVVESFTPSGNTMKINFIISIANKGEGNVVGSVLVNEVRLANVPISCAQDSTELKEKEESNIICSAEISLDQGAYISPLLVRLDYDYASKVDQIMEIKALR